MTEQAPLALANEAFGEQKGWKRHQELITALPYVDGLDAAERAAVNKLIEEELKRGDKKPTDYLQELPPVPPSRLDGNELMQAELARASRGETLAAMDLSRYNLDPPPPSKRNDPEAWKIALDNARAQLEHQRNRLLNLELLLKFGPNAFRAHNEALAAHVSHLQAGLSEARESVDGLNRERKLQQTAAGRELKTLQDEYFMLVSKNAELEAACRAVETEAAALDDNNHNNDKEGDKVEGVDAS